MKKIVSFLLSLGFIVSLAGCEQFNYDNDTIETNEVSDNKDAKIPENEVLDIDKLITEVLLDEALTMYLEGECQAEGHILLGQDTKGNNTFIYALSMVGDYGFENEIFTKVSGSGITPIVVTLDEYNIATIEYPMDGSGYTKSIEQMFPEQYQDVIWDSFDANSDAQSKLKGQEVAYATAYLKKIDRDAQIKDHVEKVLLTDKGVSVEVSNGLEMFFKEHSNYPYFIGNKEKLEDGIRMVYEMNFHENASEIEFVKYNYDTKEVMERFVFNAKTGQSLG